MVKVIPLGGLGEIGLNLTVFECGDTIFILDAGLMFPEYYMLGVDIVIPDMDYLKQNRDKVKGVILTHAHEDHIGALPYLLKEIKVPFYGTPFTLEFVKNKLCEHNLYKRAKLVTITPEDSISFHPFDIEFIRVSHSTVDSVGVAVKTPEGVIIHTGDFKINHSDIGPLATDINKFARFGKEGVLALLSDSTNVEREGYTVSDHVVEETMEKILTECRGRMIVALFASNVARIQQIVNVAYRNKKKIVFDGRSIILTVRTAKKFNYLNIPDGMEIGLKEVAHYRDNEIVLVTTGSQGEPMSVLARISSGVHKQIKVKKTDTVVLSSKFIPGNEKAIATVINNLMKLGAGVIYDKVAKVHVSGHACQEELKLMLSLTKPKFFIPVHGEFRHLINHKNLAGTVGIPEENIILAENGNMITFDNGTCGITGSVQTGRVLVDGKGVGDVGRSVLKERRVLSEDGLVVVVIIFDEETGIILYGPELNSRGFVFWTETGYLVDDAQCVSLEIVEDVPHGIPDRVNIIRTKLKKALKQYFYFTIKRRPVILPVIVELP